jgi:NitT/TauT family transport system substrate-binding protein
MSIIISSFIRRRSLAKRLSASIMTLGLFLGISVSSQAQTKIRVSTVPIMDSAPFHVALAKGFFAEQGLEIDTTPTVGGAAGLPALAAGQVQVAFSNVVSTLLGAKQGLGFQIIASGSGTDSNPPDLGALLAKKGSTLKVGKDFEGKRLGVNTRNNINWLFLREWIQITGGNPDRVTFLEVPFPQMVDAIRGDRVDAAMSVEPFVSAALNAGQVELVGWPYNVVQRRIPVAQYVSTRAYIQSNPGIIERFTRAYNKGVDWTNQNKGSDEWIKIISGFTRLAPEQLRSFTSPVFEKVVDPSGVQQVANLMRKHGLIDSDIDARTVLHRTAVDQVK